MIHVLADRERNSRSATGRDKIAYMAKKLTLVFLRMEDEILLGYKKRGFGQGQWNGLGGKVEEGESIEQSARREMKEEAGIDVGELTKFGIVECDYRNVEKPGVMEIHLFESKDFTGEPKETEEILPKWFKISEYPFDKAWPDDRYWFPFYLEGKSFRGSFLFDGYDKITSYEIIPQALQN
jgi:8-oxo-dGTP diphosphatase/2-hydroxy-dATP diphosphatase